MKYELTGLKWLGQNVKNGCISVRVADKGGSIIIFKPDLLEKKAIEKLNNDTLYLKMDKNPTTELHDELISVWKHGIHSNLVSKTTAAKVMGITAGGNLRTRPHFRPGIPYFYPLLKIHKIPRANLHPGSDIPIRLVTALQDGLTKRSDIY